MRKLNLYDSYDNVVFSYKTDHKFHGAKRITIEAPTVLKKVVVEYPAKINGEFAPQGKDKYNIWLYKGGAYCHHRWVRQVYFRKRSKGKFLPNKGLDNDKRVSVASAKRAGVPFKDVGEDWNTASTAPINTPSKGKLN